MIIECVSCNKKFEVNSDLIPNEGRTIQCGSCNHLWFYNKNSSNLKLSLEQNVIKKERKSIPQNIGKIHDDNISDTKSKINLESKTKKIKSSFSFLKLLSYIVVFIISFIAIIIILDTFKSFFPNIELILFSLFETLEDIRLFIKDLF